MYTPLSSILLDSPSLVKTGRWAGVVAAFITMSSIKDEIDWEFPGNATTQGQTNYFWQGDIRKLATQHPLACSSIIIVAMITQGVTETGLTDTFDNWHDYTVRTNAIPIVSYDPSTLVIRSTGSLIT